MIERAIFKREMERFIKTEEIIRKFEDVVGIMAPGSYKPCVDFHIQPLDLIEMLCHDEEGQWISYWFFELNQGADFTPGCVSDKDGNEIPLRTLDDLYDCLLSTYEELQRNKGVAKES